MEIREWLDKHVDIARASFFKARIPYVLIIVSQNMMNAFLATS